MAKVDRADFIENSPYEDCPQRIGYNVTISAPHMHAYCLEWMKDTLQPGAKILDVGCGSGYLCAAFHELVKGPDNTGKVVGIEHIEPLAQLSVENLRKSYSSALESKAIEIVCGDGRQGYPEEAPYDGIHVGAAAPEVPQALLQQLKIGGKLVIPVGTGS